MILCDICSDMDAGPVWCSEVRAECESEAVCWQVDLSSYPCVVTSSGVVTERMRWKTLASKGAVREHILKQIINHNVIYIFICIYVVCSWSYNILCNSV